jgi:hypothetical protein
VDDDNHPARARDFKLTGESVFLIGGDVVETYLSQGNAPWMIQVFRQSVDHVIRKTAIFSFFWVKRNSGEVIDAETAGAHGFKLKDKLEVIKECTGIAPVGTHPE